jgi:hypothetical protein
MLQAETIRTENTVKAELAHEQAVLDRPIHRFTETAFLSGTLAAAEKKLVGTGELQPISNKEFKRDMDEALLELDSQTWKREGRLPKLEERIEVRDKVIERWNKIRDDYRTRVQDFYDGDETAAKQGELNTLVTDLTTSNILTGKQLSEKQLKAFKTLRDDPKASELRVGWEEVLTIRMSNIGKF